MIDVRVPTSPRRYPIKQPTARPAPRRRGRRTATVAVDRRVVVIGLGYVGLPLALGLVEAGLEVDGVDTSRARVAGLANGRSPIDDVADDRVADALSVGLRVSGPDPSRLAETDAIIVCVPTPVTADREPDLRAVVAAGSMIALGLRRGHLVILQSTSFPGTTTGPFQEALETSGLRAGTDFDLAFAPERVNPGDPVSAGRSVPRLVGGTTPSATRRAVALLRHVNDTIVEMSSPEAAELAKLVENTFRNINIAFVNQLALLCERMGLDAWEVLDGAATKPFGFMRFAPGPGVGGHCIPVDPFYLSARARQFGLDDRLVEAAAEVNERMPGHVVGLVGQALGSRDWGLDGARVGIIGVAFKPNIRDARNAPAAEIMAGLATRGAEVRFHDPHVWSFRDAAGEEHLANDLAELLRWADVVVVVTPHAAIDWDLVYRDAELVVDTVDSSRGRRIRGDQVLCLGAGWRPGT